MSKSRRKAEKFSHERRPEPIRPLTPNQGVYLDALRDSQQIIVMGPAGTGKTFIAGTHAADQLRLHRVRRVIITRPNVPAGRSLGYFPGTLEEKFAPWVAPLTGVISQRLGSNVFDNAVRNDDIIVVPFETMRGSSWDHSLIILDEAQNTLPQEMKLFLTRIGEGSQVIINGDVSQTDLKETSGLRKVIHMVKKYSLPVPIIEFTMDDIVRSDICAQWVRAFHEEGI
ncbi:phosphate starvation-inducible PhoH-like protein [Microvirga flocculans]|uniref:Phosphate starvation-inducible PhoH-like protein n=1 Tax=Microvirga flocculans TaxID=217168 RepID=A0A7W6ICZ4_9HYPH|nr:PhoH family protein [Microvirga flocculans]MBB4039124.1 phosphate starvation-inducible PhoH-like protein [Microvirga flocculans]